MFLVLEIIIIFFSFSLELRAFIVIKQYLLLITITG